MNQVKHYQCLPVQIHPALPVLARTHTLCIFACCSIHAVSEVVPYIDKVCGTHHGNEVVVSASQFNHSCCYQIPLLLTVQHVQSFTRGLCTYANEEHTEWYTASLLKWKYADLLVAFRSSKIYSYLPLQGTGCTIPWTKQPSTSRHCQQSCWQGNDGTYMKLCLSRSIKCGYFRGCFCGNWLRTYACKCVFSGTRQPAYFCVKAAMRGSSLV